MVLFFLFLSSDKSTSVKNNNPSKFFLTKKLKSSIIETVKLVFTRL